MDLVFKNRAWKKYVGGRVNKNNWSQESLDWINEISKRITFRFSNDPIYSTKDLNEEIESTLMEQRNMLFKNLKNGFVCKNCRTNNRVVMFVNEDNQLEYRCNGCMNKWI